jgi:serine protease Do
MYRPPYKRYTAIAFVCLLVGVSGGGVLSMVFGARGAPFWTEAPPSQPSRIQAPNFADVAEQRKPAVVNISTTQVVKGSQRGLGGFLPQGPSEERDLLNEFLKRFFGGSGVQDDVHQDSRGSGFIIDKSGYIVTNNHVVENATEIKVSLSDAEEFDAIVVGRDPQTEVALIKIEAPRDLPVAPLGDSDKLRVGEWVIAIGNPFGLGQTVTAGITSAKGRMIGAGAYDDFIQTDASINPGNSGGPLLNLRGEVIGINTAIVASGQGISFAIPINLAKEVLAQLRARGKVIRGFLGVEVEPVAPELARSVGLGRHHGAVVVHVEPDSPGAWAGIQEGDLIMEFNGRMIADRYELLRLVGNTPPGSAADVRFIRQGREHTIQVNLSDVPEGPPQVGGETPLEAALGLTVQELMSEVALELGLPKQPALVVTGVDAGSPADEEGVSRGDVILEVNHQEVNNLHDLQVALDRSATTRSVLLLIRRDDNILYVALQPEG